MEDDSEEKFHPQNEKELTDNQDAAISGVENQAPESYNDKVSALTYKDHFSLHQRTSDVRYRGTSVHVYELHSSQIQLATATASGIRLIGPDGSIDKNEPLKEELPLAIEMKEVPSDRASALSLLRATYTLVALFFAGILFVFSFLVIWFLFMDMVADSGVNGGSPTWGNFFGTLLGIPVMLFGLSSVLTVAGFFVLEMWNGFRFLRTIGHFNDILVEWVTLVMVFVAPIFSMICSLFAKLENWWTIAFYTWFSSMAVFFTVFAFVVIFYETHAAWLLAKELSSNTRKEAREEDVRDPYESLWSGLFHFLSECILRRQDSIWSGHQNKVRISINQDDLEPSHYLLTRWYTSITLTRGCGCFYEKVDPPEKIYSFEEILEKRRIVTRHNWSIEGVLCSNRKNHSVVVIRGPAALKKSQIISSIICVVVATVGVVLLVIGFMFWAERPALPMILFVVIVFLCCFPRFRNAARFLKAYRHANDSDTVGLDDGVYQSYETYRVSRPRKAFRIMLFLTGAGLFFVWPVATLIKIGNFHLLGLFILLGIWSFFRYYLDPCCLLQDLGTFDVSTTLKEKESWRVKARVSTIMLNVTRSPGTRIWMWSFFFFIVVALIFSIGSISYQSSYTTTTTELTDDNFYIQEGLEHLFWAPMTLTPLGNFQYQPQPNLQYPTCQLIQDLEIANGTSALLEDYAFLATMIYQAPETLQTTLDDWFGPGLAAVQTELVEDFRKTVPGGSAAVDYNVVYFLQSNTAVVVVRGSTTAWEWMTNAQLWSSVALTQVLQFFLPAGEIFNPILHGLLKALVWVESENLIEIALYSQTTQLVEYIRSRPDFNGSIRITGQSLGGGISLITGAQTNIPAIAISGPNNVFSRQTFVPPLDLDTIDSMLFNVIPQRDIVPMTDQAGLLTQSIECRAKVNDLFGCHTATRSLCEIMHRCGSYSRPPPCECAVKYGYPVPEQIGGNQTFSDVCGTLRSNDGWYA
ncbi:lipase class 3 [Nitzschia inconspicua]|uniref:Lipase class 3 n=1 Tax=Nitzschia inconspicua TaxID=303405 RepID=A0A9K3Q7T5_9STRA|nr:lipase class 3 [Nitzschia inconspicua]